MITKQKIKSLIIIFSLTIIFTSTCIFYGEINPFIINLFADRFSIISNKDNLLVHFINVGQADALAVNLPDGKIMLIDTGSEEVNTTYVNYLKENVLNTKVNNVIDYLVLSHADVDHIGGTIKLFQNFKINTVFMPKIHSDSEFYLKTLEIVQNNYHYRTLGEDFEINGQGYKISFFEILNESNTNDSSQVVKLEYLNKSFLFVGDISKSVEDDYVLEHADKLDADVLKVSHHGSNSSSSDEFINAVSPDYSVISVGKGNDYGHSNILGYNSFQQQTQYFHFHPFLKFESCCFLIVAKLQNLGVHNHFLYQLK